MEFTKHFQNMLEERKIKMSWVKKTLSKPDYTEDQEDGTRHYLKRIREYENRWLRIIVNMREKPEKGITVFFDRRLKGS